MNDRALETLLGQLSTATRSGVSGPALLPALLSAAPPKAQAAIRRVFTDGVPLSSALHEADVITDAERALLAAGEQAGRVPETVDALAETIRERRKTRTKLLVGLAYPALLFVLGGFLLTAPLAVTRGVGAWLAVAIWPLAIVVTAGVGALVIFPRLPKDSALRDAPGRLLARLPLVGGGLSQTGLGTFCHLLGQLLAAGVPVTVALPTAMRSWAPLIPHERRVLNAIARGATLTDALRQTGTFSADMLGSLAIAEQTGTLDKTLHALGVSAKGRGQRFALMLAMALGVGAFLITALAIGFTIISGAQSYIQQIEDITAE